MWALPPFSWRMTPRASSTAKTLYVGGDYHIMD